MVFTSLSVWVRILPKPTKTPTPDSFWKKRRILKLAAHFYGRSQNCYRIANVAVIRALAYATKSRDLKAQLKTELNKARVKAACEEHGFTYDFLKESLIRSNILLNKKVLADLAVWEPRTFKCIVDYAWNKAKQEGLKDIDKLGEPPSGVLLKSNLEK